MDHGLIRSLNDELITEFWDLSFRVADPLSPVQQSILLPIGNPACLLACLDHLNAAQSAVNLDSSHTAYQKYTSQLNI